MGNRRFLVGNRRSRVGNRRSRVGDRRPVHKQESDFFVSVKRMSFWTAKEAISSLLGTPSPSITHRHIMQ